MSDGGGEIPPTPNFPLKNMSEKSLPGEYTVYQHQPLFQTTTNITLWKPNEWQLFFPILCGINTFMYFVGSIGTLKANIVLSEFLKVVFGGV